MIAGSSAPFQFTYTNNNNGSIANVSSPTANITLNPNPGGGTLTGLSSTCSAPVTLAPSQSCVVNGTFTLGIQGNYTVNDFASYTGSSGGTSTTTLSTSTNIPIAGAVTTPLPNSMGAGEEQPVLFTFTNGSTQSITPSSVTFSPVGGTAALASPSGDGCTGVAIPAGGSCTVSIIFSSLTPQPYSVFATLTYPGGSVNTLTTPSTPQSSVVKVTAAVTTPLPAMMLPGDTAHIVFTFTNGGTGTIYDVTTPTNAVTNGVFVADTPSAGSCGFTSTIVSLGTCTYSGTFTAGPAPVFPNNYSVTAKFNYAGGMNLILANSTTTSVPPTFVGVVSTPLPTNMGAGEQQPFGFTFTNTSAGNATPISVVVTSTGGVTAPPPRSRMAVLVFRLLRVFLV